jgi:hypothetical protein
VGEYGDVIQGIADLLFWLTLKGEKNSPNSSPPTP